MKNHWKLPVIAAIILILPILFPSVNAAAITSCTADRNVYYQDEEGYISLIVYNDKDDKIRVYEITATIDYFYTDGVAYLQVFQTNATLPVEILPGESETFYVPFKLPQDIAPGYARVSVRAKTELWNSLAERWFQSDFPTDEITIYIESQYKQQYEEQVSINQQLQEQISDLQQEIVNLQTAYSNILLMAYILLAMVTALVIIVIFIVKYVKKPVMLTSPPPE